jgi:3-deoxy-7-phosphoheptulonate synthase
MIEVHPYPDQALCAGAQSLGMQNFSLLMKEPAFLQGCRVRLHAPVAGKPA